MGWINTITYIRNANNTRCNEWLWTCTTNIISRRCYDKNENDTDIDDNDNNNHNDKSKNEDVENNNDSSSLNDGGKEQQQQTERMLWQTYDIKCNIVIIPPTILFDEKSIKYSLRCK